MLSEAVSVSPMGVGYPDHPALNDGVATAYERRLAVPCPSVPQRGLSWESGRPALPSASATPGVGPFTSLCPVTAPQIGCLPQGVAQWHSYRG
jgi:hypothetical protein